MTPTAMAPTILSPDDMLKLPDQGKGFELVDGELKELAVSTESSRIGGEVYFHLRSFAVGPKVGWVFPPETGFTCFPHAPNRVRKPDTAFVSITRMPVESYRGEGLCRIVPDLVAEVLSPHDLAHEVNEKRDEWLEAGVRIVWVIDPDTRSVEVYRGDGTTALLRAADSLTAPELLPGFSVRVADLFRLPGEPRSG